MKTVWLIGAFILSACSLKLQAQNHSTLYQFANKSAFHAISATCVRLNSEISLQGETNKQHALFTDGKASVSLMLREFIEGRGPEYRTLHQEMQYVKRFMASPGWAYCCRYFLELDSSDSVHHSRYQFSPKLFPPNLHSWIFSFQQHRRVLHSKHIEQLFLGSFDAWAQRTDAQIWQFTVYNRTSRKSLFLTLPKRIERPKPLGTIYQVLVFQMSETDMKELVRLIP